MTKKYIPHLPSMHALCEHNYIRLMRLLPDVDETLTYRFETSATLHYEIVVLEVSRYTSTVKISQLCTTTPSYLKPVMTVRLYHDARMAEVLSSQNSGAFAPSYEYPNHKMRQRNEKHMINSFLAEWLQFCLSQRPRPVLCN